MKTSIPIAFLLTSPFPVDCHKCKVSWTVGLSQNPRIVDDGPGALSSIRLRSRTSKGPIDLKSVDWTDVGSLRIFGQLD